MYLIWQADYDSERFYTTASIKNMEALIDLKLLSGESLIGKMPEPLLSITSDYPPADYFGCGPLFIVSSRLRNIFDQFGVDAEYFPATLVRDEVHIEGAKYFFANIMAWTDCLDRERSRYVMDGEYIDTIDFMVIDAEKADHRPLFRLANTFDVVTVVSEGLAKAVSAAGITGVHFISPQEWKW